MRLTIRNFIIFLFDYKNHHIINNLSFKDYLNTQNVDSTKIKKIKYGQWKEKNINKIHQNEFYKCSKRNINLCPLCKGNHDKEHNIIEHNKINYICREHIIIYCFKFKKGMCISCEKEHSYHRAIYYGNIIHNQNDLNLKLNEIEAYIDKINRHFDNLESTSNILFKIIINELKKHFHFYYKIKKDILYYLQI